MGAEPQTRIGLRSARAGDPEPDVMAIGLQTLAYTNAVFTGLQLGLVGCDELDLGH